MNGTHEPCNPQAAIQRQIDVELAKIGIQSRLDKCIKGGGATREQYIMRNLPTKQLTINEFMGAEK